VKQSRSAAFEETGNNDDLAFLGDLGESFGAGAGDGLGEVEGGDFFALAKIWRSEKFLQTDDLCALGGSFPAACDGLVQVGLKVWRACHLHQADLDFG